MKNALKKVIVLTGIIFVLVFVLQYYGFWHYLTLDHLRENGEGIKEYVQAHYLYSVLLFFALCVIMAVSSIPVVPVLNVGAGFLFGVFWGAIYTNIAATIGCTLAFLFMRSAVNAAIYNQHGEHIARWQNKIKTHGISYLLILHFITIVPYVVINSLAAMAGISLTTFIWTTFVGFIPGSFMYAYAGQQLSELNSLSDLFSWKVILLFLVLVGLACLPMFFKARRRAS